MNENGQRLPTDRIQSRRSQFKLARHFTFGVLLLATCFGVGLGGGYIAIQLYQPVSVVDRNTASDGSVIVDPKSGDLVAVAKKASISVVSIITTTQRQELFTDQVEHGAGSGIILTKDGLVLTNKHVVVDSGQLSVISSDGTVYDDVKVVGTDPLNDLAFIKINNVKNLVPAVLGDSSSVKIGVEVFAIGNSLGEFQNTVTRGIISGTGRPIYAQEDGKVEALTDLLQTDAAINPGNSGGPLINLSGQVIGVNTAIAEDAQSIGFSIPINSAKGIIKHLKKTGKIKRAYLGINYVSINYDVAKEHNLPVREGAYVFSENGQSVVAGSPAKRSGIQDKDIIIKVGDLKVGDKGSVASLIAEYATGETIKITILRSGEEKVIKVTLATYGN